MKNIAYKGCISKMIYCKKAQIVFSETLDLFYHEFLTDTKNNCKFTQTT